MGFIQITYYTNKQKKKIAKFLIKDDETLELLSTKDYEANLRQPKELKLPKAELPKTKIGIGEVVASVTKLFGFKPCAPCNRRRKYLNKITPNWLEKIITKIYEHGKTKNKK